MNKKETEYERQQRIFAAALDLEQSGERASYLEEACGEDLALRESLEELVREYELGATLTGDGESSVPSGGNFDDTIDEKPGSMIGRYKLLEKIGEGGFGTVYMADQTEPVVRRVAVKVIKPGMDSKEIIARFEAERQALAMMDDPNIAKVLDAGATESGRPYFVMELVKGIPITQFCNERKLNTRQRLDIFIEVCSAVQHAHQKGIIHRDLKPSNVLVTLHGDSPMPKVIDFGIAKATQQQLTEKTLFTHFGQFVGTPAYMSPEQASMSAIDVDTRSDIYSLGVLLYELLAGAPPFDQKSLLSAGYDEMRRIIAEDEPPKPSTRCARIQTQTNAATGTGSEPKNFNISPRTLRGDLDCVVMKAIDKDRSRRYETANAFAADIGRVLEDEPVLAAAPGAAYKFKKFARRNKAAIGVASAMALLLLAGITATGLQAVRATAAEKKATETLALVVAESDAKTEALEDAEASSKFLTDMFVSSKPGAEKGGREVKVAEILDRAAEQLDDDTAMPPKRRAHLQEALADTYSALGLHREAIPLAKARADYLLATSGPEHPDTLIVMNNLAYSYRFAGRQDEALEIFEKGLELSRRVSGPEHPDTLIAMNNLAVSYGDVSRLDEALEMKEEVLDLRRKVSGPEHPGTLNAMDNLAVSYRSVGRLDEALEMGEKVLALSRKVLGSEHPATLAAMDNLASSYQAAGRRDEALKMGEEVLELSRKVFGPEHPSTLRAMNNLAVFYDGAGRQDEALEMGEEVLALSRKVLGSEHPDTLNAVITLANSYQAAGRLDEALKMREEVLPLLRKVNGPEHPETLTAMGHLANSYQAAGRLDEALKMREEVLDLRRKVSGPEHPQTLTEMGYLANSYQAAGRLDEALEMKEEVLDLRRKVSGPEHPQTLTEMGYLANSYQAAGRLDEALKMWEEVLDLRRKVSGPEHPQTLTEMGNLANSYQVAGRPDEALKMREEVLPLRRKVNGPEHPDTLNAMNFLGISYHKIGRFDEALKIQEEVLGLSRKMNGPEHPHTLSAMNNLAVFYDGAGRQDDALKMREEVLPLRRKVNGPEHLETLNAMNYLAISYYTIGRLDEALEIQEEVLVLSRKINGPEHPSTGAVAATLGYILDKIGPEKNGKGAKTIEAWKEAVRINPKNAQIQYYLGRLLVGKNRLEEAVVALRAASALYPGGPRGIEMREHLVKALSDLGREEEAKEVSLALAALTDPTSLQNPGEPGSAPRTGGIPLVEVETPETKPEGSLPDLTGQWLDMNDGEISIAQDGAKILATSRNAAVTKHWTKAEGLLGGRSITMTHYHDEKKTDSQGGKISEDGLRIDWANGSHWKRKTE